MEHKCSSYQKEFSDLQEKDKLAECLQDEAKMHDCPSTLTERESSLKTEKKRRQEAYDVVSKVNHNVEEDQKYVQRKVKIHVEALKALEGEVAHLREKFHILYNELCRVCMGFAVQPWNMRRDSVLLS